MSLLFPEWTNTLPKVVGAVGALATVSVVAGVTYYFTPKFWEVGYEPVQPVSYSHKIHVQQLGIDCRYCHSHVEESPHANIPDTQTCMNCHTGDVATSTSYLNSRLWESHKDNANLIKVRSAAASGEPIEWRRVHKLPDYVYFNHSAHVNTGISCVSCHGRVDTFAIVRQEHSLSMSWCLSCHRAPENHLVPLTEDDPSVAPAEMLKVTDLERISRLIASPDQKDRGLGIAESRKIEPPQNCGACHY
ncbi:MAG: cytochrome c3 family protein [Phycisphaeraceae bacterium]|nr:cytochrome c3 family protein [Phycisphaerales bacterium]MCA9306765.1 cytochrome c3 family protein [Phycisphaerales bacterium]MCB9843880.1 cytochrome c3 family protein [Phycisphaeraceae bacterium]